MARRIRQAHKPRRRPTFLRAWREKCGLSLEDAGDKFDMSAAQLSRVERGLSPYTQDFLEMAAIEYRTNVPSLLLRNPHDPDSIFSVWDQAGPAERDRIVAVAKALMEGGS